MEFSKHERVAHSIEEEKKIHDFNGSKIKYYILIISM